MISLPPTKMNGSRKPHAIQKSFSSAFNSNAHNHHLSNEPSEPRSRNTRTPQQQPRNSVSLILATNINAWHQPCAAYVYPFRKWATFPFEHQPRKFNLSPRVILHQSEASARLHDSKLHLRPKRSFVVVFGKVELVEASVSRGKMLFVEGTMDLKKQAKIYHLFY